MRNIAVDRYRKNTAKKNVPSELVVSLDEIDEFMAAVSSVKEEDLIEDLRRILNEFLHSQDDRACTAFILKQPITKK